MMRACCLLVSLSLFAGCASGSGRTTARNVLIAAVVGTAAMAAGTALAARSQQTKLDDDVQAGKLSGKQFVDRDHTGLNWNRATRASLFLTGVSLFGLGLVWEAGMGERVQSGPAEPTPADDKKLIFPVPSASTGMTGAAAAVPGAPFYRSATAR